jgi:hypothetical protein
MRKIKKRKTKTYFATGRKGIKNNDIKLKNAQRAAIPLLGVVGPALSSCLSFRNSCIHITARLK